MQIHISINFQSLVLFQTCKTCDKKFSAIYKLKIHSLIHSKTPPFTCSICAKGMKCQLSMSSGHNPDFFTPIFIGGTIHQSWSNCSCAPRTNVDVKNMTSSFANTPFFHPLMLPEPHNPWVKCKPGGLDLSQRGLNQDSRSQHF